MRIETADDGPTYIVANAIRFGVFGGTMHPSMRKLLLAVLFWTCLIGVGHAQYLIGDEVQLLKTSLGCEQSEVADSARRVLASGDDEDWRLFYAEHASTCQDVTFGVTGLVTDASLQYELSCVQIGDEPTCLWFPNQILAQ